MGDSRIDDDQQSEDNIFGSLVSSEEELSPQGALQRIEDLTTQVSFLDAELSRYRDILERERIKSATDLADQQLLSDTKLDDLRREQRREFQALADVQRAKLDERQVDFEQQLSRLAARNAELLEEERARHQEILQVERTRRDIKIATARNQARDEANDAHNRIIKQLRAEAEQAASTIARLERDIDGVVERAKTSAMATHHAELETANTSGRMAEAEARHAKQLAELEEERDHALERAEAERQRSAATLAELLEQSATIAAEADRARDSIVAEREKTEAEAAAARERAKAEYKALVIAADERATLALARETELESLIAELRQQLQG